ncbi:MAG: PhoH-like ATPase [Frankiaceae bacterium]|nr:PhoH-like ATPase [Frankiaceae bacterium]
MPARKTYVLDTSVVLSDPRALGAFDEHDVVLPLPVLGELEGKRHHPDLGWAARQALRRLESLRLEHGGLDSSVPANDGGGTLRVEMNHRDLGGLPSGLRGDGADVRILAVAANLAAEGADVTLVSKDLPLRLKASVAGVAAEDYRRRQAVDASWTGLVEVDVAGTTVDALFASRSLDVVDIGDPTLLDLPVNTGVVLHAGSQSALARLRADKRLHLIPADRPVFGLSGRSAEQRVALDLLADPDLGVVSLGGPAGTGKTVLAIAAGLEAVLERREFRKLVVFRPLYAVGGQDLGYLPGSQDEKMEPWAMAVTDALEAVTSREVVEEVKARGLLEVVPLTHIRGRTLSGTWVVVDEVQNLERTVLLAALSRLGEDSRAVLCWDIAQRDNLHVGRHDGIVSVVDGLKGHPLFGHVSLTRSERSPVAALASRLLEENDEF